MKEFSILIVEDIDSIRTAIFELLSEKYEVFTAPNYNKAVEILNQQSIDLVITDIRMPGKSGLDLIEYIRANYPKIQYALITAYDINQYIHFAKNNQIWNIIPKYSSLDLNYISIMVYKLFYKDIFGIEKYFPGLKIIDSRKDTKFETIEDGEFIFKTVKTDKQREHLSEKISKFLIKKGANRAIQQILEELTSNAMIRAPKDSLGKSKYQTEEPHKDKLISHKKVLLSDKDYFEVGYGIYKNSFIVVIRDHHGSLPKEEILYRLDRQVTILPKLKSPLGINDTHGRGLFICREMADQLIINIQKNKMTEIIAILNNSDAKGYKGLSIFEIE